MSVYGLCDRDEIHHEHVDGNRFCPGQFSLCRNCDDRKCMGCVFREYYHECVDDCPFCCNIP